MQVSHNLRSVNSFDSLCSTSICEYYLALIVSSMPAFASFFKGEMPGASLLASLSSLVLRFRSSTSRSKVGPLDKPNTGLASEELPISGGRVRNKGYVELHDTRYFGGYGLESVITEIRGEGAAPTTLEGVVHKTVTVHQSMRQERPAL